MVDSCGAIIARTEDRKGEAGMAVLGQLRMGGRSAYVVQIRHALY